MTADRRHPSLTTCRLAALIGTLALLGWLPPAWAADVNVPEGRYTIWIPDTWKAGIAGSRISATASDESISVVAQVLPLPGELAGADFDSLLDTELDDFTITRDEIVRRPGGELVRRLEGTGKDEGDDVLFRIAASPREKELVIVLVYGEAPDMTSKAGVALVERALKSLVLR